MRAVLVLLVAFMISQVTCDFLKIMSMTMKDLTPKIHACSQAKFDACEAKFQGHVQAAATATDIADKQELWCDVLQSHKMCMDEILSSCMVDYPLLSNRVQTYLKEVVSGGCTKEGKSIDNGCADKMRKRRSTEDKTLYDLASDCLKNNTHIDDHLSQLLKLLKALTRSIQHLYKRLPEV